jgi:hypothetical protein
LLDIYIQMLTNYTLSMLLIYVIRQETDS